MPLSATYRARGCEGLVHNAPNGARAAAALSAATQAMVDLSGRARNVLPRRQRRTHIVVGENVARAHDHCGAITAGRSLPGKSRRKLVRIETVTKAKWLSAGSPFRFSHLFEHDLIRKPVPTFRDHALVQARHGCKEKIIFCKRSNLPEFVRSEINCDWRHREI